jgi:hypothetical protein
MKQPVTHATMRPMWPDAWNPYKEREYIGHLLDDAHFHAMLDCDSRGRCLHSIDALGAGCLDAPEDIPCGSTMNVRTIAGYDRERYHRMDRECDSYAAALRGEAALAGLIKEILAETE